MKKKPWILTSPWGILLNVDGGMECHLCIATVGLKRGSCVNYSCILCMRLWSVHLEWWLIKYVFMLMTSWWFASNKWGYSTSYVHYRSELKKGLWVVSYDVMLNELNYVGYELCLCMMLLMMMKCLFILRFVFIMPYLNVLYDF